MHLARALNNASCLYKTVHHLYVIELQRNQVDKHYVDVHTQIPNKLQCGHKLSFCAKNGVVVAGDFLFKSNYVACGTSFQLEMDRWWAIVCWGKIDENLLVDLLFINHQFYDKHHIISVCNELSVKMEQWHQRTYYYNIILSMVDSPQKIPTQLTFKFDPAMFFY